MPKSDIAVSVRGLSKSYTIAHEQEKHVTLAETMLARLKNPLKRPNTETFWALKDINFDIKKGDVVGIIGRNGAGKSTLLKILSRITEPTTGRIDLYGRVGSLLEVGTGFHPELTGRENIFLNGAILGMSKAEIRKQFDAIVDFASVEKFLDTPVKRYSSGMYVRLAFAVAAHLNPEILIVDEVLAVGDAEFQNKCLLKIKDVSHTGRTVLFVSHNMLAVRQLCSQALILNKGRLISLGKVHDSIAAYLERSSEVYSATWTRQQASKNALSIEHVVLQLTGTQPRHMLYVSAELLSKTDHASGFIAVDILDSGGSAFAQAIPTLNRFIAVEPRRKSVQIEVELPPLIPGIYAVTIWVGSHNSETLDLVHNCAFFEISQSPTVGRTVPHTLDHGHVVPNSRLISLSSENRESNPSFALVGLGR